MIGMAARISAPWVATATRVAATARTAAAARITTATRVAAATRIAAATRSVAAVRAGAAVADLALRQGRRLGRHARRGAERTEIAADRVDVRTRDQAALPAFAGDRLATAGR